MPIKYFLKFEAKKILLFAGIFFFFYCDSNEFNHDVLREEIFVQAYCDIISHYEILPLPKRKAFSDSIFAHYQITEESFTHTIEAFQQHPEKWKKVFEEIIAELERRLKQSETLPIEN